MFNFRKEKLIADRSTPRIQNTSTELDSYLDYYKQLQDPGYAVLITGPWGTGKSHQTKEAIGSESHYVSLFGLRTTEDIYSSVFAKMFPTKAKLKGFGSSIRDVSAEFGGAGGSIGGIASGVINAFIRENVENSKILIFDDLERCSIPIKECLGAINKYVEHHGCRVVVIAHDEKLTGEFLDAKEKIFGHVITAHPQYDSAFEKFIEKHENSESYNYLLERKQVIIKTLQDSKCESLRILKHTIEDLSRIYECIAPEHKSNKKALSELTDLFTALSFEVRSGALKKEDILNRSRAHLSYYLRKSSQGNDTQKPRSMEASERHPNININSQLLGDEVLVSMLFNGVFDAELIKQSLNNSLSYTAAEDIAAWRAFMNLDEMTDFDTKNAADRLIRQFDNREINRPGEILHLFAFRLLKSHIGFITSSLDETVEECKKYLDELLDRGEMPHIPKPPHSQLRMNDSFGGYAYWVHEDYKTHFAELHDYLTICGGKAVKAKYPSVAEDLLKLMRDDCAGFVEKISGSTEGEDWYAYMDVLSAIQPKEFVQTLVGIHPKDAGNITNALKRRYSSGELGNHLRGEADWLIEVISLLEQERDSSPPLRKMRIERAIPWHLKAMAEGIVGTK